MLRKCLVIGLGGSAEKLVRYLNRDLEQRLLDHGWRGGVPAGWRFLCLDVAERSDVLDGDVPSSLGATGRRVGLARYPLDYAVYFRKATDDARALPALARSLMDEATPVPPPFKGAGQRPQVGYAVGVGELDAISQAIDREIRLLDSQDATEQLAAVARALEVPETSAPRPSVIVASSLAGGSGAGLLQLVVELLLGRATEGSQWLRTELTTLLFTPDVFADLRPSQLQGVQANSLHTIAAMLNGYEAIGAWPEALATLLGRGGATLTEGRRAAPTSLFVGGRNAEFAFDHQNKAIEATAKALGRLLTDPHVSNGYSAHLTTNSVGATALHDFRLVDAEAPDRQASSLGYANVTLGHSVTARYAAERLAKLALETFLRGHLARRRPADEREDHVIERLTRAELDRFLTAARLRPADVLGDVYQREQLKERLRTDAAERMEVLRRDTARAKASQWLWMLEQSFRSGRAELAAIEATTRELAASAWSEQAGARVTSAVTELIGRCGASVATAVLAAAQVAAREAADEIDLTRRERIRQTPATWIEGARDLLRRLGDRVLRRHDQVLERASSRYGYGQFLEQDALYHELAAGLLRELADAALLPLQRTLEDARVALVQSERKLHRALVQGWPDDNDVVPPRLEPAPNERLLVPLDQLPALIGRCLMSTTGAGAPKNAYEQAVTELVSGGWPSEEDDGIDGEGVPAVPEGRQLIVATRRWAYGSGVAEYVLELDAQRLLERARTWVDQRRGALSAHLRTPISAWIDAAPGNAEQFADTLEQALRCAAPLLSINPAVQARVHGEAATLPQLYVSALPISSGHRVRARIEESLRANGVSDGAIEELFDPTSRAHVVEVSGFLAQRVHPVVIDGLFVPIRRNWQTRTSEEKRQEFAKYRRLRPLPLFVPLSPNRQQRFAAGWLTARLLGQLDVLSEAWSRRPLSVWSPQGWLPLPTQLLGGDVAEDGDALASVLETLPLALASYACEQYDELEPYLRLLDLGDLRALQSWVANAELELPDPGHPLAPTPSPALAGLVEDAPAARSLALREALASYGDELWRRLQQQRVTRESVLTLAPWCELGEVVLAAIGQLHQALEQPPDPLGNGAVPSLRPPVTS